MQILKKNYFLRILSSTQRTQKLIINGSSRPKYYTTNASKDEPVKYSESKYYN